MTQSRPKSMLRVRGRPFIEYQLELLRGCGCTEIVLCLGHLSREISDHIGDGSRHGLRVEYSIEERPLGTAGALKRAEQRLGDEFLTMYGDSYLFLDPEAMTSRFRSQGKLALMTVYRNHDRFETSNVATGGGLVTRYDKAGGSPDMVHVDYGASIFRREALEAVPADRFYALEDLFAHLAQRRELLAFEVERRFYEIGSPGGLRDFEAYLAGRR